MGRLAAHNKGGTQHVGAFVCAHGELHIQPALHCHERLEDLHVAALHVDGVALRCIHLCRAGLHGHLVGHHSVQGKGRVDVAVLHHVVGDAVDGAQESALRPQDDAAPQ